MVFRSMKCVCFSCACHFSGAFHFSLQKFKTYLVGLPPALYERPGPNERFVLNQLFLLLFRCFYEKCWCFSWKVHIFHEKCMLFIIRFMSFSTPSKLLMCMSQICAWAILCSDYLEPNLSIFEVCLIEMQVFPYFCAILWSVMGMFQIYDV